MAGSGSAHQRTSSPRYRAHDLIDAKDTLREASITELAVDHCIARTWIGRGRHRHIPYGIADEKKKWKIVRSRTMKDASADT